MPLYDYLCTVCKKEFEAISRVEMKDSPVHCPTCGGMAKRQYPKQFVIRNHPTLNEAINRVEEKHAEGRIGGTYD